VVLAPVIVAEDGEELVLVKNWGAHLGTEFSTPHAPIATAASPPPLAVERARAVRLPPSASSTSEWPATPND